MKLERRYEAEAPAVVLGLTDPPPDFDPPDPMQFMSGWEAL